MTKANKISPEARERTVRRVLEHRVQYPLLWAAIESNAPNIDPHQPCFEHYA